jgi:major type 1 subunit fimbrin (pilin)
MNTLIKRATAMAIVTTAMTLPLSSQASDGTITCTGAVTANTCTISVTSNGVTTNSANATVALPTVSTSALDSTATKTTAAGTFFNITLTGCTAVKDLTAPAPNGNAPVSVGVFFEAGPNVDTLTGGLINSTAAGSSNVEVNLYLASKSAVVGTQIIPGSSATANQATAITPPTTGTGTQYFYAGYSTTGAAAAGATAGAVNTSVTYSLVYQ